MADFFLERSAENQSQTIESSSMILTFKQTLPDGKFNSFLMIEMSFA